MAITASANTRACASSLINRASSVRTKPARRSSATASTSTLRASIAIRMAFSGGGPLPRLGASMGPWVRLSWAWSRAYPCKHREGVQEWTQDDGTSNPVFLLGVKECNEGSYRHRRAVCLRQLRERCPGTVGHAGGDVV